MDANTIRLILLVVGALLILLLYLWERHREREEQEAYEEEIEAGDVEDAPYGVRAERREPRLGQLEGEAEDLIPVWARTLPDAETPDAAMGAGGQGPSGEDLGSKQQSGPGGEPEPLAAVASDSPDPMLIQVTVSARRYPFKGSALLDVSESCGLHPGEMDIFHCCDEFDDETRVYFSMANMVKPGTFPFDAMEHFSTPGVMLFAQLEGDPEDMTILDEMIATARKLALALNGDVLDDTRRPLTVRKEEEMRRAVLENEARWAKATLR